MRAQHAAELAEAAAGSQSLNDKIAELKKQIEALTVQKANQDRKLAEEQDARRDAEEKAHRAQEETKEIRKKQLVEMERLERELNEKERELRARLKKEIEALVGEHLSETEALQVEFGKTQQLMEEKYRQLEARFGELQELYDGRPSRPEDMELIRQLQEDILQKDNLLKKAAEDMKFYKLELINREESYNKMFGANPNVGVLNPLATKVRARSLVRSSGC